jgi:uncharacterized protein (DUF58 family)
MADRGGMPEFTFNPNDLHRLNRLMFTMGRLRMEVSTGGHRTSRAGEGLDFLDYRPYSPGDDVRTVDWNLFGRLRQLFVRLNETPKQLSVTLLIDSSRSMLFGSPVTKLHQAQCIACGLGFIAFQSGDRVYSGVFADGLKGLVGPLSGRASLPPLVRFLQNAPAGGGSDLLETARQLRSRQRHRGLVIILSDFLNVAGIEEATSVILGAGGKLLAIQVLDLIDRGAGLQGRIRLRDSETGKCVDVFVNEAIRLAYQSAFELRRQQLEHSLGKLQQHYLLANTTDNYVELVCQALRSKAIVR